MKKTAPFGEKFVITGTKNSDKILAGTAPSIHTAWLLVGALYESGYEEILIRNDSIYLDESSIDDHPLYPVYKGIRIYLDNIIYSDLNDKERALANASISYIQKFDQTDSRFLETYSLDKK